MLTRVGSCKKRAGHELLGEIRLAKNCLNRSLFLPLFSRFLPVSTLILAELPYTYPLTLPYTNKLFFPWA